MSNAIEQFGKYILLEKLAMGGMAEVYLAKSTGANGVNKFLAIKRILPQFSDNEEFIGMFKEEAKIAVNLNHGNVVSIYDFGVEKSQFYLVMEYVEGRNLRQMINELKKKNIHLSTEQVVYIIKEVAAGLDHAHRCIDGSTGKPLNITHRDMSPQNIMVSFEGEVKIIDFGIAKAETQLEVTKAGTLKGKFGYMSPEQADGYPIDLRTDVFSLGIVLWELLANDRLFTSNSEAAILRKIRECQIPPIRKINPSVHPELERIVNKALTKDKTLRYQTSAAFHRDLNRFINTQYPEFSPHDFSVFIKNAFTETYSDQKKKLVEYAKILNQVPEESVVTVTTTQKDGPQARQTQAEVEQDTLAPHDAEGSFNLDMPQQQDGKNAQILRTNVTPPREGTIGHSGTMSGATSAGVRPYTIGTANGTSKSKRRPIPQEPKSSSMVAFAMTCIVVVGLGYFIFGKNKSSQETTNNSAQGTSDQASKKPPRDSNPDPAKIIAPENISDIGTNPNGVTDPLLPTQNPQTPQVPENAIATIYSDPDNATLYIDDVETGFRTPYRLSKPMNQGFKIKITKSGYFPIEKTVSLNKPTSTLRFNLAKEAYGYINLYVVNAGSNPLIEINGALVNKKLPLVTHKIPAGVPVTIRVVNEFLGTSALETITVTENQKKFIELVLKSSN